MRPLQTAKLYRDKKIFACHILRDSFLRNGPSARSHCLTMCAFMRGRIHTLDRELTEQDTFSGGSSRCGDPEATMKVRQEKASYPCNRRTLRSQPRAESGGIPHPRGVDATPRRRYPVPQRAYYYGPQTRRAGPGTARHAERPWCNRSTSRSTAVAKPYGTR